MNPENVELMHIRIKDENQLKTLMDDEEYEEFCKELQGDYDEHIETEFSEQVSNPSKEKSEQSEPKANN